MELLLLLNALWLWRNRNGSVSFWWKLLYWMNNLCNCCILVCRAWVLPGRCVWRTVSVCSDCTNTSCSVSPLKLSEYLLKLSSQHPLCFPWQAECRMSGPCCVSLRAVLHPLLCTQACLHQRFFSSALAYLAFSLQRHNGVPGLTKDANISTCQKAALIFPGCLSLFSFSETIRGMWSWFREGFVPSHFCDSGIWEERKRKNVILEEDILEDVSDLSLASKELGSPGWAQRRPSSQITGSF